jgi:EmrB/QacA subfamily drug resistance transporter
VNERAAPNKWLVTAAMLCGTLCIGVTMSMMHLAVPLMMVALAADIDAVQWIITGPMLVNLALVPLVSWLTAVLGARQVYLWAIGIWIATALPCGLSESAAGLIVSRLLQRLGGSLHIPTVIAVVYQAFPRHQRGLALGLQQGAQWAAPAIGMTLGGYLLQRHGWPATFFYPIPIGLVSMALAWWAVPTARAASRPALDWRGLATLTPALSLLVIAVSHSQRPAWSELGLGLFGAALGGLGVFAVVEQRQRAPLLDLALFRRGAFSAASAACFLGQLAGMGVSFAIVVFLQQVLHYSPLQVGLLLLPATLARAGGELAAGHLADRWAGWGLALGGLALFAVACGGFALLHEGASRWRIGGLLVLGNLGMALSNSPILHAGLRALRDERLSMGSGMLSLLRIVGGMFGVALVGPLVALGERWGSAVGPWGAWSALAGGDGSLMGYRLFFALMALLPLATAAPAILAASAVGRPRR